MKNKSKKTLQKIIILFMSILIILLIFFSFIFFKKTVESEFDFSFTSFFVYGQEVKAYIYQGNLNGILYIPGGEGFFTDKHKKAVEILNSQGYTVLVIDYSSLRFLENRGDAEIQAATQALDYFSEKIDRLIILGTSHGAWISANLLEKQTISNNKIIAGIVVSGAFDLKEICDYWIKNNIKTVVSEDCLKFSEKDFQRFSPILRVENINSNLLILHGENDKLIPISESYKLRDKIKELNKDYTIKTYSTDKHGVDLLPFAKNDIFNFLNKNFI